MNLSSIGESDQPSVNLRRNMRIPRCLAPLLAAAGALAPVPNTARRRRVVCRAADWTQSEDWALTDGAKRFTRSSRTGDERLFYEDLAASLGPAAGARDGVRDAVLINHRVLVPVFRPRPHPGSEASRALLDHFARRGRRGRSPENPLPVLPRFMGPKAARRWRARLDSCREGAARVFSSFHGPSSRVCRLNLPFTMTQSSCSFVAQD